MTTQAGSAPREEAWASSPALPLSSPGTGTTAPGLRSLAALPARLPRKLSVAMIVLNEEERIGRALDAVRCADEIVVVDGGSTDRTREICQARGCRVLERRFDGFGAQRTFAVGQCSHDWILTLDADEEVTPELDAAIRGLLARPEIPEAAFKIEMQLVFLGRRFRFGKHAHERHVRLFDQTRAAYDGDEVHEGVSAAGAVGTVPGRLVHHSFRDIQHFLHKMNDYSTRGARMLGARGKGRHPVLTLIAWPYYFVRSYVLQANFLNGVPGLVWSFLYSLQPTMKYLKLDEAGRAK